MKLLLTFCTFFAISSLFFSCKPGQKMVNPAPIASKPAADTAVAPHPVKTAIITRTDKLLEEILEAQPHLFDSILRHKEDYKLQIIYTQIDRQANNNPVFKTYYYNYHPDNYFYPASTVKLPIAIMALQKLNELEIPGLDKYSTFITEAGYNKQTPVYNDPSTPDGKPNIAQYIKKILLVSDNDAYNRLYEFLGQEYINEQFQKMGYQHAQITHRLEIAMSEDENRHTNPLYFFDAGGKKIYEQGLQFNQQPYKKNNAFVGNGYYSGGKLQNQPMDFSKKNKISLEELTQVLKSVLFPAAMPAKQRFNLTAADYRFLQQYLSQYPLETVYPAYDSVNYWNSYVKFLYYGAEKQPMQKNLRIFNKVGDAYGFLLDVAYVADFEKNIEFMLSAVIYCNSDGILNDDNYDYEHTGFPFMKNLGQVIYNYELKRVRKQIPDLSNFKIGYDK
jgi:Beta-lactamase enzyme family